MPVCLTPNWLDRYVRERRTGRVGKVTADLQEGEYDLLAVWFGPGQWNRYEPNEWSKAYLFDLLELGYDTVESARACSTDAD